MITKSFWLILNSFWKDYFFKNQYKILLKFVLKNSIFIWYEHTYVPSAGLKITISVKEPRLIEKFERVLQKQIINHYPYSTQKVYKLPMGSFFTPYSNFDLVTFPAVNIPEEESTIFPFMHLTSHISYLILIKVTKNKYWAVIMSFIDLVKLHLGNEEWNVFLKWIEDHRKKYHDELVYKDSVFETYPLEKSLPPELLLTLKNKLLEHGNFYYIQNIIEVLIINLELTRNHNLDYANTT